MKGPRFELLLQRIVVGAGYWTNTASVLCRMEETWQKTREEANGCLERHWAKKSSLQWPRGFWMPCQPWNYEYTKNGIALEDHRCCLQGDEKVVSSEVVWESKSVEDDTKLVGELGKAEEDPQKGWMKSNGLWNFDPNFDFWSWGRFGFWVPKIPKIESWEIQKSKFSHELFGDEPFETSILWFLNLTV